jgi:hypothetical protein
MTNTRNELDERLLAEARSREQGRNFRRVLGLIAIAVVIAAIGFGKDDQTLAFAVAGLILVAALVIAFRGDRFRR